MSFSSEVKTELCRELPTVKCCAVAESYGALLYANSFSPRGIRIITGSREFAQRLPRLFRRAFGVDFDRIAEGSGGRFSLSIEDSGKIAAVYERFGVDPRASIASSVNFAVLENDCCRASFVRGAFLAGGSVTEPTGRYHLELATVHAGVSRSVLSLLLELGFSPGDAVRGGSSVIYFKQSSAIEDFLTTIGAPISAMSIMSAKVEKDMNSTVNRRVNCDSANADKVVSAAQEQIAAIRRLNIYELPDRLRDTALLRIANPEASLADLASLSSPPVSKSCLSHRLRKLCDMAGE